jgi:D-tyrosyl-tRNA(Tyr) deacylase
MIGLLQRVSSASVVVDGATIGAIDAGLMVLVCAERHDTEKEADALLNKLLGYRVFADEAGKMNRSVTDTGGGCCWCRSSRWQPTPIPAPALRSRRLPRR